MKIYTKTGDDGTTGLYGGPRVAKDDARIEAYGTVDELNAFLGLVLCEALPQAVRQTLAAVQHELFSVGAELATPEPKEMGTNLIGQGHIARLESAIDDLEVNLPPLRQFVVPGGSRGASLLHVARGVCRRAERRVVTFAAGHAASPDIVHYLNRLSDYLFVAARTVNAAAGQKDVPWQKPL